VEDLEEVIRRIAAKVHREINELNPIVDARLEDGSRVNAVYKNVALNGPILTIRRFPSNRITMEDLLKMGTLTEEAAEFLQKLVISGYNIFISGGTSSGKTTFLNVLTEFIPKDERVIVIEDAAELQITDIDNIVRLECRNANVQGKGEVNVRQLIKASLRMRPNRIIVGEVRGEEVLDMIQAMNTGHDGSLSTGHGNSPEGMLSRIEAMFLQAADFPVDAIRSQIAEAIDIMIHLGRLSDKSRKVLEITEIEGYRNGKIVLNPLYKYKVNNSYGDGSRMISGSLASTGNQLKNTTKLEMNGVSPMKSPYCSARKEVCRELPEDYASYH
jgi:pilus assembly protein CpaF